MKTGVLLMAALLAVSGLYAQDLIVRTDGNVVEARVLEISPTELRYRRFDNPDGPVVVLPVDDVFSIRYENGTVEVVNPFRAGGGDTAGNSSPTLLQEILNALPPVTIAGNSLKFDFAGVFWTARLNGRNFSRGTIDFAETAGGGLLTLTQTHIYPGAIGDTAGRIAGLIPGGDRVGSMLSTAGNIAEAAGPIESSGSIVLDYRAGPPASLSFVSASGGASGENGGGGEGGPAVYRADIRGNWISGEAAYGITSLDSGLRYERMTGEKTSFQARVYYQYPLSYGDTFLIFENTLGSDITLRLYPFGKRYFLGAGWGYRCIWYSIPGPEGTRIRHYMSFPLETGWKFDPGKDGALYLETGIGFSLIPARGMYYGSPVYFEGRVWFALGVSW